MAGEDKNKKTESLRKGRHRSRCRRINSKTERNKNSKTGGEEIRL
jgi:hypothetical protein